MTGGGDAQPASVGAAPRDEATTGQHHPIAERRQLQRLAAPVGVAGHPEAMRIGVALVDEPPDQLLGVARLVPDVGQVDVSRGACIRVR
jgi:hypothetical protein